MFITADTIPIFSSAIIREVTNSPLKINLMELGFLPGKVITLQHSAPMGGPMAFKLEETILALRKTEASLIQVEIL
ncbi:FeoA family protein [Algoriphagus halophytocola]|uniref:Ferrous iron transport protein A n=1 Tax=Algoriphagus halophytocola TaxID=2991499 RepID=A0ABY6MJA7_9BACT|nr:MULTISPECIES: FeoA family protein [unclassified Algoriphagus]UZD23248.1 ferrous iron transport protein A [Algoriphagus sp. TR-M5]WBL44542.1 FeoA family protein [Algoriphagus sp. TR-M9]